MSTQSTIFALATPPGTSGVAVIRISGPDVQFVIEKLAVTKPEARRAALSSIVDPRDDSEVDRAIVIWFPRPRSFTGEDVLELHVHGSPAIIRLIAEILISLGLEPAKPGDFVRRAFANNKLDLIGVEALDSLLHANDTASLKVAQGQIGEERQKKFRAWRRDLIILQANCEALIDFPDDDLPENLVNQASITLNNLSREINGVLLRSQKAQELTSGLEVLIVGPPNVGKSSLINAIAGYERAIVTSVPGTTRDFVEMEIQLGPFRLSIVDTAGLRDTNDEIEKIGIDRTYERAETATLILNLYEKGKEPIQIDAPCPIWEVQSKVYETNTLSVAAGEKSMDGVSALLDRINSWLTVTYGPTLAQMSFHRERQVFHVKQAADALDAAAQASLLPELRAEHLRHAQFALSNLSGQIHVEDVLDTLFKGFCIGK